MTNFSIGNGGTKMPNKNYVKGRAKEYRLKKKYEEKGYIVMRTAGSHGFADLIAINSEEVLFIQSKPKSLSKTATLKLYEVNGWVCDERMCKFIVE